MSLIEKIEAKAGEWIGDLRHIVAEHEAQADHALDEAKAALLAPIGEALATAVHVKPEMVVHIINTLEADLAKFADGGQPDQPAPAPAPGPSSDGPVVAGAAL